MDLDRDVHPLADFRRDAPAFLRQLRESGNPLVLTVDGKAEVVVQDARSYRRLLDLVECSEKIEAVREGLASLERGEGRPMDECFDALERSLRAEGE